MAITVGSFQTVPSVGVQTAIGSDQKFDEAIIYFGVAGANNTSDVDLYVAGESNPIPFSPGDKMILNGAGGEELNFTQFEITTGTGGDGVTVIYQLHDPYGS